MIAAFFQFSALVIALIVLAIFSFGFALVSRYQHTKRLMLTEIGIFVIVTVFAYFYFYDNAFKSTVSPERYFAWHEIKTEIPLLSQFT